MWLMIAQRLRGGASLETAVLQLLSGLPQRFWPRPAKRLRDWWHSGKLPSHNTGAYNQARKALALSVVEHSCDRIAESLTSELNPEHQPPTFLIDGTSMRLAHSRELVKRFPPGSNQHGEGHWPVLVLVVAHDLWTGLAIRPEWGPMYGDDATSEQKLLDKVVARLPQGATVMGDANFGVFTVAHASAMAGHPMLLRLTTPRAQSLAGGKLRDGIDRKVLWRPSAHERRCHKELDPQASVAGRLVVRKVCPSNGTRPFLLALFTTRDDTPAQLLKLYGQRWNIETDLRTLKKTLRLDQLTSATEEMVAKEIELGITAYNLVRASILLASEQSGLPPRSYRFTSVSRIVETFTDMIDRATDPRDKQKYFDQMMQVIQQARHPHRRKPRGSYPRQVWQRGKYFPTHKP